MKINIYESPIVPSVNLDENVVVYVPGYANMGPSDPTYVTSDNFTALFGEGPYIFKKSQEATIEKNNVLAGTPEKSWILAKKLVDAGLTVLYHRQHQSVTTSSGSTKTTTYLAPTAETAENAFTFASPDTTGKIQPLVGKTFYAKAKYFGAYYSGLAVRMTPKTNGVTLIEVLRGQTVLESANVSCNPQSVNFLGIINFSYIEFEAVDSSGNVLPNLGMSTYFSTNPDAVVYCQSTVVSDVAVSNLLTVTESEDDEFQVKLLETSLGASDSTNPAMLLKDYDQYATTYITPGGYFNTNVNAGVLIDLGDIVKAVTLIDLPDNITDVNSFMNFQNTLLGISTKDDLSKSQGTMLLGCDTFTYGTQRLILPDWSGYLIRLGANVGNGIPAWVPVANNSNGVISSGVAATRPVSKELSDSMTTDTGCSVNPIVYKRNVGYVIMGNRTLYPNKGVLEPQSFLNCRLVINSIERSARASSSKLAIVSTDPQTAFKTFRNDVSNTADKMLVNGDGLNSYSIKLLPKTKPATIDIAIDLVVVEGIETFNIHLTYSIALD